MQPKAVCIPASAEIVRENRVEDLRPLSPDKREADVYKVKRQALLVSPIVPGLASGALLGTRHDGDRPEGWSLAVLFVVRVKKATELENVSGECNHEV